MYLGTPTCYGNRPRRLAGVKALKILCRWKTLTGMTNPGSDGSMVPDPCHVWAMYSQVTAMLFVYATA